MIQRHDPNVSPKEPLYLSVLVKHDGGLVNVKTLANDWETRFFRWAFKGLGRRRKGQSPK